MKSLFEKFSKLKLGPLGKSVLGVPPLKEPPLRDGVRAAIANCGELSRAPYYICDTVFRMSSICQLE
jgi:hypothetical protein